MEGAGFSGTAEEIPYELAEARGATNATGSPALLEIAD